MLRTTVTMLAAVVLAGCAQHAAQVTSGKDYLAAYQPVKGVAQPVVQRTVRRTKDGAEVIEDRVDTISTDALIRHAADIEPLLRLPARIGLARIEHGKLSTIPNGEAEMWMAAAARHRTLGTFAAIDPFLAGYTLQTVLPQDQRALRRDASDIITKIRLGAARQHMDAVLIYEVGSRGYKVDDFEGLRPIRVLGQAPLPAAPIEKEGVARAFLMDVRNGYPYGVASASVDLKGLENSVWDDKPEDVQSILAKARITQKLITQAEAMFGQLTQQMQTKLASAK